VEFAYDLFIACNLAWKKYICMYIYQG